MDSSIQCKNCVLDNTVEDISFDENGICCYCHEYIAKQKKHRYERNDLTNLITKIKRKKNKYDCIVGVSGGLDSSYMLHLVRELGLSPLAVHCDSGWNSETAVSNIEKLTKSLNIPLHTCVIDWEEFKRLQVAYLKSGVVDLEFPTDHVYLAALYAKAHKFGIKTIFTGNNLWSEGVMPECWIHNKGDTLNMLDIYKRHGDKPLKRIPLFTLQRKFYYYNVCRIKNIFLLNYIDYDRNTAKEILKARYGWRSHPTKHGENIFTRFYHRYILPRRFNVDIRKAHLSSLICCGQLSKNNALEMLKEPMYSEELLKRDKEYVLKKLGLSESDLNGFMNMKRKKHSEYRSERGLKKVYNKLRTLPFGLNHLLNISNHC